MYKCAICNCMYFTEKEAKECQERHEKEDNQQQFKYKSYIQKCMIHNIKPKSKEEWLETSSNKDYANKENGK